MKRYEVQPADLEMRVKTLFEQGRTRLTYNLHSPTGVVAFAHREIAGPEFQGSSEELQSRLLKKIERLGQLEDVDGAPLSTSERVRKLESLGQDLWRELLPLEIRSAYREIRRSVRSWTIVSDEPWIPWELIKPYDPSDPEEIPNDEFLALKFELTRWVAGDKTPAFQIFVERLAIIEASQDLPLAVTEKEMLIEIINAHPDVTDVTPRAHAATDILEFLQKEAANLIHFIGHGIQVTSQPEESGIQLQDGSILRAVDLDGAIAARIGTVRPLVFLNACWAGRQGRGLTRLGGWATRLVGICGCGAFVAPMWPVRDSTAATFAQTFYKSLVEGASLGRAALAARQQAFRASDGDPSALAYAIYGNPNARIHFGPKTALQETESSERFPNELSAPGTLGYRRPRLEDGLGPPPIKPAARLLEPLSSNLRIKRPFTDRQRDKFLEDSFDYIAVFFENSLGELHSRYQEVETSFRRVDANRFTAAIYVDGEKKNSCRIWRGDIMIGDIAYASGDSGPNNTYNEVLSLVDDGVTLLLRPSLGFHSFGSNRESLSAQGAAEYLWSILVERLQ